MCGQLDSPLPQQNIKRVLLTAAIGTAAIEPELESIPIMLIRGGAEVNRQMAAKALPGSENRSMLALAASHGLLATGKAMIVAGADVNMRDNRGKTPLFEAAKNGHLAVAKELLRAGARTDVTDDDGTTLLNTVRRQEQSPEMVLTGYRMAQDTRVDETQLKARAAAWARQRARMIELLEQHSTER